MPSLNDPVLPIIIVLLNGGIQEQPRPEEPPDLRHWQIKQRSKIHLTTVTNTLIIPFGIRDQYVTQPLS